MLPLPTIGIITTKYSFAPATQLLTWSNLVYFKLRNRICIFLCYNMHRLAAVARDSPGRRFIMGKVKFYLLIDFPTLKEILCSCDVGLQFPWNLLHSLTFSVLNLLLSFFPHSIYPPRQWPCHPWSFCVFSASLLFSSPLSSSTSTPLSYNHLSPSKPSYSYSLATIHHCSHQTRNCWIL